MQSEEKPIGGVNEWEMWSITKLVRYGGAHTTPDLTTAGNWPWTLLEEIAFLIYLPDTSLMAALGVVEQIYYFKGSSRQKD